MGIAENSSVLTWLFFVIKNLKNLRCANLLASGTSYLLFVLNQSKDVKLFIMATHSKFKHRENRVENPQN